MKLTDSENSRNSIWRVIKTPDDGLAGSVFAGMVAALLGCSIGHAVSLSLSAVMLIHVNSGQRALDSFVLLIWILGGLGCSGHIFLEWKKPWIRTGREFASAFLMDVLLGFVMPLLFPNYIIRRFLLRFHRFGNEDLEIGELLGDPRFHASTDNFPMLSNHSMETDPEVAVHTFVRR